MDIGVAAGDLEAGEIQGAADCSRTADGGVGQSLGVHDGCCCCRVGVTATTVVAAVAVSTAAAGGRVGN